MGPLGGFNESSLHCEVSALSGWRGLSPPQALKFQGRNQKVEGLGTFDCHLQAVRGLGISEQGVQVTEDSHGQESMSRGKGESRGEVNLPLVMKSRALRSDGPGWPWGANPGQVLDLSGPESQN